MVVYCCNPVRYESDVYYQSRRCVRFVDFAVGGRGKYANAYRTCSAVGMQKYTKPGISSPLNVQETTLYLNSISSYGGRKSGEFA